MSRTDDFKSQLASLKEQAEVLLQFHGVYDITAYGWLDADTPDPEYAGLAMWQTQPPFTPEWSSLFEGKRVTYEPTTRDEVLVLNGEDFTGTMIFARRSLGMALVYSAIVENEEAIDENLEFWHEYATTMQWLNIASDRIRDYFVMAKFGKKTGKAFNKAYGRQYPDRPYPVFSTPFEEALTGAPSDDLDLLRRLRDIAGAVQNHRTDRNHIVHDVATHTAQLSLWIVRDQRQRAAVSSDWTAQASAQTQSRPTVAIAPAIEQLKRWYIELVQMSSLVFEFDYFNRS